MFETVTVDEAIKKGHRMVTYPVIAIIIILNGFIFYSIFQHSIEGWHSVIGILLSIVIAWLYWSIMITRWRLWAFDSVRNVHELKKRAMRENLIWRDGSFYGKTEIRTSSQKERWNELQSKFDKEDVFNDDINVPSETIIYYSKAQNFIEMVFMLGLTGYGIYMLAVENSYILGTIFTALGVFLSYKEYKQATNMKPQIIINEKGIQTVATNFYEWKNIENEDVISERSGRSTHYYLTYNHPAGAEKLQIDDFNMSQKELNNLLIVYKGRYNKKNKSR